MDQWVVSTRLRLEKAAYQISLLLAEKLELVNLIAKADEIPNGYLTQAFMIQQLIEKKGVRFVDIQKVHPKDEQTKIVDAGQNDITQGVAAGLYTMELCGDVGFCAPVMDTDAADRTLRIVRGLGHDKASEKSRLIVRISFDSFLAPIREMKLGEGSTGALVTSTGQFLAATDKSFLTRKRLGDNGNELEKKVLSGIRHKAFGTVFGKGHPPDVVIGFYKIPALNWYILLFSQGKVIMEPILDFRFYYLIAGVIAIAAILLLIRLTTRSVGSSIGEISAAAAQVRQGDYAVKLPENRSDEIGQLSANFNEMVEGLKQRDLMQHTFGRYVDKKVADELMTRPEALRLGGEIRTVTIMMSDLRDFTVTSEKLRPEEVIKMLNRYFARMIAVIEKHKGIIVDFYGDSILVFFNGVESDVPRRAIDALNCALEMQREMKEFVKENIAQGLPELSMGIGIHTGEVIVGNIGTESRAKYGIVGANVNLTDRIQYAATGGKVVISDETYNTVCARLNVASELAVCLKGVEEDKKLYEIESVDMVCEPTWENTVRT